MTQEKAIPVTRSSMPPLKEYVEEISSLWDSHWLTNMGEKHQKLELLLKQKLDVENIALYTNGHSALECAIEALNLKGKIITTPFTFASTTHAIVRKGLQPVFVDIKPTDFTIDADKIERLIDEETCAILPVHVYGNLCDVDKIQQIADSYGLKVIYDAAHAFGVRKNGVSAAAYGDVTMFSFHATKVFNTIEGGALCFRDSSLAKYLNEMKNFGIVSTEKVAYVGGNSKMNEFCAAMGICNLRHLDSEISKRKNLTERYCENLKHIPGLRVCAQLEGIEPNYSYMPVIFEDTCHISRDAAFELLKKHQINARKYFYPLVTDFDCYKDQYDSRETPIAKYVAEHILTLPLYSDLLIDDVDKICDILGG